MEPQTIENQPTKIANSDTVSHVTASQPPSPTEAFSEGVVPKIIGTEKKFPWLVVIFATLFVATLIAGTFFFLRMQSLQKQLTFTPSPTPTSSSTPVPSDDETADWETYSNDKYGFSFSYPKNYQVKENTDGYFVISSEEVSQSSSLAGGISIDARMIPPYDNFETATQTINKAITISSNKLVGTQNKDLNWSMYQGVGKDGMLKGVEFKQAIIYYPKHLLYSETIATNSYGEIFDKILNSFRFTSQAKDLSQIRTDCISLQGATKYWNDKYQECLGKDPNNTAEKSALQTFCKERGGTFYSQADTCRHAQEEGTPCGPELTFYCGF